MKEEIPLCIKDEKAFEALFREYFLVLHEYAVFYTENSRQAEDIVQDIFLKIWESRKKLIINTSMRAYLFRSVHNSCIQYLRQQSVRQKYKDSYRIKLQESLIMSNLFFENGLTKLFEEEIESLKNNALNLLPEKTRKIFILSRDGHLKNSKIAEILNINEKTVEYHISRALGIIRHQLSDYVL
ncbi:MAG: RNA polymerase sigma-70 factor [Bacteroidales bacterium]|nr:RNA polymerase sigma-70 factor [Bacteroidales bacterium]